MDFTALILTLLALAAGLALGWLGGQKRSRQLLAESQNQSELARREAHSQGELLRQERAQHENLKQQYRAQQERLSEQMSEHSRLQANYQNLEQKLQEQKSELEQLHQKFSVEFKNLAQEILEEKSQKFTEQNKQSLGELLNPLRERMQEFQQRVEQSHLAGEKRSAAFKEQIESLQKLNQEITLEAKNLTLALKGESKTQGGWGEMQLESILQAAGLEKDLHYRKEANFKDAEGNNQRPDYVVQLPDDKHIVVDSKVSLTAYARYFEAEEEGQRALFLRQHLQSLKNHIDQLSERNYQQLSGTHSPDYVLLFLANEPALSLALREDAQLFERALRKNIVLVSSSTLLATLRTISYIWRQDAQNKNAEEIARQAGDMYDKFVGFSEDLIKLGRQLDTAQGTYRDTMNKLIEGRGNLVRRAENLRALGVKPSKEISVKLSDRANGDVE